MRISVIEGAELSMPWDSTESAHTSEAADIILIPSQVSDPPSCEVLKAG